MLGRPADGDLLWVGAREPPKYDHELHRLWGILQAAEEHPLADEPDGEQSEGVEKRRRKDQHPDHALHCRRDSHDQVEERPDALQFWERLNGGLDPVGAIQRLGPGGEDLQRPRMAVEQTLKLGDAVAIFGMLGQGADGELTLSPEVGDGKKAKGAITNDMRVAATLQGVQPLPPDPTSEVHVLPLGKHKKARNYRGKVWR